MPSIKFDVLISKAFADICTTEGLAPVARKHILSLLNDFEDGKWRYERFNDYIWNNIALTALSKQERDDLINEPKTKLRRSAKNLRLIDNDERGKGSEIAEILLYGVMQDYYGALPVVPKIYHKQNVNDNAKGADSVHIVLSSDGKDFSLWFGEAKFYKTLDNDDLEDIIQSVLNSLDKDKIKKENSIITDLQDLDLFDMATETRQTIKDMLSQDASIDKIKPKLHIPIMLLHQCGRTASAKEMTQNYREILERKHIKKANEYFKKQIETISGQVFKYDEINFHLILFPVPEKDEVVRLFLEDASIYRRKAK